MEIVVKFSFPIYFCLKPVQHVLVIVDVLQVENAGMVQFNLAHRRAAHYFGDFGKIDGATLWRVHHPSAHKGKESSCQPVGMFNELKHCLFNDTGESDVSSTTN